MRVEHAIPRAWAPAMAAATAVLLAGWPGTTRAATTPVMSTAQMTTVRAKVLAVDLKNRTVDVQGPKGNKWTILCDERVRNLPQVKVGDNVVLKYYEAVALAIHKAGTAKVGLVKTEKLDRAEPGARPHGVLTEKTTANVEVLVVNRGDNSVTFKNTEGHTEWVKVKDPKLKPYVKQLKVGDIVSITYEEAVAVSVEPA
jgi:hypothetical protein